MKNSNNTFFMRLKIVVVILAMACTATLSAQTNNWGDDVDDTGGAPIDGGISILLAAGAVYGIRKLRNNKN